MSNLQHTFWTSRRDGLMKSINLQEKSLYTWALLLKEADKEYADWVKNYEVLTGVKIDDTTYKNDNVLKKQNARRTLIDHVINYFVNEDEVIQTPVPKSTAQQVVERVINQSITDDDDMFCQDTSCPDPLLQSQSQPEMPQIEPIRDEEVLKELAKDEDLLKFAGQLLLDQSEEEKEMLEHMDARRAKLQEQQEKEQEQIKQEKYISRDDNLSNYELTDEELMENINKLMANDHMNITQVVHGPPPEDPSKKNIVKENDVIEYVKPYSRPGAPINALTRISRTKQNELLQRMYLNAKRAVLSATADKNLSDEEKDTLIQEEADRLLQVYLDTH